MNKEDLILQTLAQMQDNMSQMQTDMNQMQTNMGQMQTNMGQMQNNINQIQTDVQDIKARQIRMEQDHGTKLQALFDAREAQKEVNNYLMDGLTRVEGKVDQLSLIVTSHEVALKKIK